MNQQGVLTSWILQSLGLVKTQRESESARGTHKLKVREGETYQDKERKSREIHLLPRRCKGELSGHIKKETSGGHSLAGEGRDQDWSGYRKKVIQRGILDTHFLEKVEVGTGQATERKKVNR